VLRTPARLTAGVRPIPNTPDATAQAFKAQCVLRALSCVSACSCSGCAGRVSLGPSVLWQPAHHCALPQCHAPSLALAARPSAGCSTFRLAHARHAIAGAGCLSFGSLLATEQRQSATRHWPVWLPVLRQSAHRSLPSSRPSALAHSLETQGSFNEHRR